MKSISSGDLPCEIVVRRSFVERFREGRGLEKTRQSWFSLRRTLKSVALLRALLAIRLQGEGLNTLISFVLVCSFHIAALLHISCKEKIICMIL